MRIRSLVTIALLLPGALSAQRRMGGRVGGRPAPPTSLPPMAPTVAREMSYVPRPYSAESYTFISFLQQPSAATSLMANYGSLNAGTRIDYRLNPHFSVTGDFTAPIYGGPVSTLTFELGTRFRPAGLGTDSKFRPYLDARAGYVFSSESFMTTADPTAVNPVTFMRSRFGRGKGAIAGGGSDIALTRSLSLTTGLWATRSKLHVSNLNIFAPTQSNTPDYWQTSYRLALGVRWNPMRAVPIDDEPR